MSACVTVTAEVGPKEGGGSGLGRGQQPGLGTQHPQPCFLSLQYLVPYQLQWPCLPLVSRIYPLLPHLHGHHLVLPPLSPHWCPCLSDPVPPLLRTLPGLPPHPEQNLKSLVTRTHRALHDLCPHSHHPSSLCFGHNQLLAVAQTLGIIQPQGLCTCCFPFLEYSIPTSSPTSPNLDLSYHPGFSSVISSSERPPWPE